MPVVQNINSKINDYIQNMKDIIISKCNDDDELIGFIRNYDVPDVISKEDLIPSKRTKNVIPLKERCEANKSNSERCSRRKKGGTKFCGTHIKGTPHGKVSDSVSVQKKYYDIIEMNGITYFMDNDNNIYNHHDIYNDTVNPRIIGKLDNETIIFI